MERRSWRWDVPGFSAEMKSRVCREGMKGNREGEEVETVNNSIFSKRCKGQELERNMASRETLKSEKSKSVLENQGPLYKWKDQNSM